MKRSFSSQGPSAKKFAPWFNALEESLKDPALRVFEDDQITIIRDKFPKARFHYLALAKSPIDDLEQLTSAHVSLLEHLIEEAHAFVESNVAAKTKNPVRLGFHQVPSMKRLHLHIISQDFDSACLKHKKHWNSFTTPFFMDAEKVLTTLKEKGKVALDKSRAEELLKDPLRCHVCKESLATIPKLKDHIKMHDKDEAVKEPKQ
ncbi:putative Aprataxin [Hypsibius exemplaris]|uniref:Aprataxin n=1 Tax=Hypsibius exemplaris TaxID=2072580 RepID=A0A9X6NLB3_HYPEX|nr:putative Aprataxin [Hypsibius exemplaris]